MKNQNNSKEIGSINKTHRRKAQGLMVHGEPIKSLNENQCRSFSSFSMTLKSREYPKPILQGLHLLVPSPDKKGNRRKKPHRLLPMVQAGVNTTQERTAHDNQAQATPNMEGWSIHENPHTVCCTRRMKSRNQVKCELSEFNISLCYMLNKS